VVCVPFDRDDSRGLRRALVSLLPLGNEDFSLKKYSCFLVKNLAKDFRRYRH